MLLDEKISRILYANGKLSEVEVKKIHSNYEKCTYNKCNQRVEHFQSKNYERKTDVRN